MLPSLLAAVASGALLFLAGRPAGLWPLALVALVPLLWTASEVRARRALLLGFIFGLTYYGSHMWWLTLFGKPAWAALAAANAAYTGLFGLLLPLVWRREVPMRSAFATAALWTAIDFARGAWPLGGLTWGALMYTQTPNPSLLRLAPVTGGWGITFAVALINALLVVALRRGRGGARSRLIPLAVSAGVLALPMLIPFARPSGRTVEIAALQQEPSAIDNRLEENRRTAVAFAGAHRTLIGDPPDLAVWPENALDDDPRTDPLYGAAGRAPGFFAATVVPVIRDAGVPTLVGVIAGPTAGRQYNESLLFDGGGRIADRYAKTHLVPFGEYAPLRGLLGRFIKEVSLIRRDLTPGADPDPLTVNGMRFGNVICFENAFPSIERELVAEGAEFLVVSTNNANYGRTPASDQHVEISRVRAAETGRWLVHSGLTGPTAIIDPAGRIHERTQLFTDTVVRGDIVTSGSRTLYVRFGDWFAWACVACALAAFLAPRRRARSQRAGPLPPKPRTLVVLPTYNEAGTIGEVLSRLLELPEAVDVLVVDDNSPDGTAQIVQKIAAGGAPVRLVRRAAKAGLASAYVTGFETGIREGYDLIVEMDSDLSHQPEELPALLHAAHHHDLTLGSRYLPGGSVTNWGLVRRALSRAGNLYARMALGIPIRDATSGFRVFRRGLLEALMAAGIHADGYGFQIELAYQSWLRGYSVGEVPITFREREHGTSKISRRIVVEALWLVTVWGLRDRLRPLPPDPGERP